MIMNYRKEIKRRMFMSIIILVSSLAILIPSSAIYTPSGLTSHEIDFLQGFVFGICMSIDIFCIYYIIYYYRTYNSDAKLKKLYIKEHDERELTIQKESGYKILSNLSLMLLAIALISGYFNFTVFITIICIVLTIALYRNILYAHYSKKY